MPKGPSPLDLNHGIFHTPHDIVRCNYEFAMNTLFEVDPSNRWLRNEYSISRPDEELLELLNTNSWRGILGQLDGARVAVSADCIADPSHRERMSGLVIGQLGDLAVTRVSVATPNDGLFDTPEVPGVAIMADFRVEADRNTTEERFVILSRHDRFGEIHRTAFARLFI
jgi:hypothetical protein